MSNNNTAVCPKCTKPGHEARACKVTWRKAWPGKSVAKFGIRMPDGSWMEITAMMSDATQEKALALWNEIARDVT